MYPSTSKLLQCLLRNCDLVLMRKRMGYIPIEESVSEEQGKSVKKENKKVGKKGYTADEIARDWKMIEKKSEDMFVYELDLSMFLNGGIEVIMCDDYRTRYPRKLKLYSDLNFRLT